MVGRVLFLSAVAYASYWYIRRSNRKVKELREAGPKIEILPPDTSAVEPARPAAAASAAVSRAAEPDPGR
jgi:hypothetical protein